MSAHGLKGRSSHSATTAIFMEVVGPLGVRCLNSHVHVVIVSRLADPASNQDCVVELASTLSLRRGGESPAASCPPMLAELMQLVMLGSRSRG